MKKHFRIVFIAALASFMMACSKEDPKGPAENYGETIEVSIDAFIEGYTPQDETKSEVQTVARVLWSNGDKVHVYNGIEHLGILTADITGTDGLYAKLRGSIKVPTEQCLLTLVHSPLLPTDSAPTLDGDKLCIDLSLQEGSKVPFLVYGTIPSRSVASITSGSVKFSLATSVYKVNCTGLPESGEIIRAQINNVNTVCALTLIENSDPVVSGEEPGKITRSGNGSIQARDERAYINFALVKTGNADRQVSIRKTTGLYYSMFDNLSFGVAKAYNIVVSMKPFYPDDAIPGTFTFGDKHYVFAKGNLWYGTKDGAAEATYNFEDSQLDYSTTWNPNHISHFYWSKSAEEARAYAAPVKPNNGDVLFTESADFIANGQGDLWHAPSLDDWYEFFVHSKFPYGRARVTDTNGKVHNGVMLIPDDFTNPLDKSFNTSGINEYSAEEFAKMEYEGVVFLPNAGWRRDSAINEIDASGIYYPSTMDGTNMYYFSYLLEDDILLSGNSNFMTISAAALRLVTEMQ